MKLNRLLVLLVCIGTHSLMATRTPVFISTERLYLREFVPEDLNALIALRSDQDFMSYSNVSTPEKTALFLEKHREAYERDGFSKWAVIDRATNTLIGYCGLCWVEVDGKKIVELGYRLAKEYWGRGLGTEAVIAAKNYAFTATNLTEIVSCITPGNERSVHVAEKNGMTLWKKGTFLDEEDLVYRIKKSHTVSTSEQE